MYKGRLSIKELMDMDNREFHALYHAAWQRNVERIKAEEAAQKAEREASKKSGRRGGSTDTQGERLAALRAAVSSPDIADELEEALEG